MGFFSKIGDALGKLWDGVENVFKGILRVFDPILRPIAKFLDSSLGKVVMLAASVFTFGASLMAGGAGFMSGLAGTPGVAGSGGFLNAFVEGGKAFASTLLGTGADKASEQALTAGANQSTLNPMALNMQAAGEGSALAAGSGTLDAAKNISDMAAGNLQPASNILHGDGTGNLFQTAANTALNEGGPLKRLADKLPKLADKLPKDDGNWLTKAAGKAWKFASSEKGQNLIGSALEGFDDASRDQARIDHWQRYDRKWEDPNNAGNIALGNQRYEAPVPNASTEQSRIVNTRNRDYAPSVQYTRAPAGG
jgi:hypothetical protein